MPEGPEVLTVTDQLDFYLSNRNITNFIFSSGRYRQNNPPNYNTFIKSLPLRILKVECKGKVIFFHLSNDWYIVNSLRMTGCWSIDSSLQNDTHLRVKIELEKKKGLFFIDDILFIDIRNFGTFEFVKNNTYIERRDSLKNGFIGEYIISLKEFREGIEKCKNSLLVNKLCDQKSICSGIGNYLLSEILYDSRIHPNAKCRDLCEIDIETLYNSCNDKITQSYNLQGLTMRDYKDTYGNVGSFGKFLKVYGNRDCDENGFVVKRGKRSSGQTTWYVDEVQIIGK